jgi:hypothetical protein
MSLLGKEDTLQIKQASKKIRSEYDAYGFSDS